MVLSISFSDDVDYFKVKRLWPSSQTYWNTHTPDEYALLLMELKRKEASKIECFAISHPAIFGKDFAIKEIKRLLQGR